MKSLRSLQGRARTLFSRTEHSAVCAQGSANGLTSTSGRTAESSTVQATPVFKQFHGHSQYGPHSPSRLPWKEGVLLLSGGAIGWVASRNSSINLDLSGLKLEAVKNCFKGIPNWPLGAGTITGPNFLADAAAKAAPAVVSISVNAASGSSTGESRHRACGSGFITDATGIVMTNAHVVEEAMEKQRSLGRRREDAPLRIALQDGRVFEAAVVSVDRVSDLALVKVKADGGLPTVKMGSSTGMRVGEWVLALGSPLTLQNSVTAGIVSCVGRKAKELGLTGSMSNYIQTDAAINTGNSGGPLVNLAGEVVGVSCMKAMNSNGLSFAIPIDSALQIMKQLEGKGRVVRPYIGIKMLQLNAENAAQMQGRNCRFPTRGILVPSVAAASPAAQAGLKQGDIITGFGEDESVEVSTTALIEALTEHIGSPLKLRVTRGDQEVDMRITAVEARQ